MPVTVTVDLGNTGCETVNTHSPSGVTFFFLFVLISNSNLVDSISKQMLNDKRVFGDQLRFDYGCSCINNFFGHISPIIVPCISS